MRVAAPGGGVFVVATRGPCVPRTARDRCAVSPRAGVRGPRGSVPIRDQLQYVIILHCVITMRDQNGLQCVIRFLFSLYLLCYQYS